MDDKIVIGLQEDRTGNESYSEKWKEYIEERGHQFQEVDLFAEDALEQSKQCDGIMWRWLHNPSHKQSAKVILYSIEKYLNIPVYPNSDTSWHYDEKISQYYLLRALDVPIPQTWLFWDRVSALKWAESAQYPLISKLSSGAGSSNVIMIKSYNEAIDLINKAFKNGIFPYTMNEFRKSKGIPKSVSQVKTLFSRIPDSMRYLFASTYPPLHPTWWKPEYGYVYFQEFLQNNQFDTRITVIGERAFGYRRMNRPNDFRASGSGNFDTNPELIDQECIELAFNISNKGNFQCMAYDFLNKDSKPVLIELSYTFVDWMVHCCPGHWNPNLEWKEGHMWPEEAQVEDFIASVSKN